MSKSIGIDLGTTNSVGAIKRVQTEIIKNSEGDHITPSCVTIKKRKSLFSKHSFVVGKDALEWIKQDPENTVVAVKRLMGRSTLDNEVSKLIEDKRLSYHIQPHSKGTANSLGIVLKGTEYAPEEISAEILKKIRMDAETFLGGAVDYAVITVPAYFNDKQKHATRTAAAIAGLKVQRLLPEPTAAAISFGVDMVKGDEAATVLVFDFGGGTFDLSVLTISGGQFIEQGKGGDMWLGGEDLDRLLMEHVTAELAREYNIDDMEAFLERQNTKDRHRFRGELKSAVEKAKVLLSTEDEAYIEILGVLKDDDGDLIDVDVEVTRDQFEAMIAPMVEDLVRLTRKTLENIHFTPDLIDRVLLVGGSSQIPRVIAAMKELFSTEKVMVHDRPMLAVAEGAAILSHRLAETFECPKCGAKAGRTDAICGDCGFDLEKYIIDESVFDIVHSAAHDYYIRLENGQKHLFVEKNTPLPLSATETFKLVHPEQKLIHLKFFNMVNDNEESIGDLWLGMDDETTNAPLNDGEPLSVEITLNIDENNLIEVTATLKELPDVSLSKTLSRGSADEKLLVSIEDIIVEANNKKYGKYTVIDLLGRVLSAIRDANRIVDPETGRLDERLYNRADLKIQKARRMAADGIESRPVIYYANNALSSFEMLIPENRKNSILKAIETLKKMDEEGSYDENVKAIDDLHAALDDLGNVNVLMQIQKAGDICNSMGDRSRASKFYRALDDIMQKFMEGEVNEASAQITGIMPEVGSIIENYDHRTGIIYKDITR